GATDVAKVRDGRERRGCEPCPLRRLLDALRGVRGLLDELFDLRPQRAPMRVQLEQHRLGGLAGEPELAALWVPADSVLGDGGNHRREQLVARNDRKVREVARVAAD